MKLGLLGGSFDPIHNSHIDLANAARKQLGLDKVLIMPSGEPPYRKCHASRADRLNMVSLACKGMPWLEICDLEITRPGASYAIDSLSALRRIYPQAEITYILGGDAASRFDKWHASEAIRGLCRVAFCRRKGHNIPSAGMLEIDAAVSDISSSQIREMINMGRTVEGLVPAGVMDYIAQRGLYISPMTESEIRRDLAAALKPSRFAHTLSVASTAVELARLSGLPAGKALYAGLLHDCAKNLPEETLMSLADEAGADADEKRAPQLLHAPVGALLAEQKYGVHDSDVLRAIRRHTIGFSGMSLLDVIVYVADFIEPSRKPFEGLERVRDMARIDIDSAAAMCARMTVEYARGNGYAIHPATEFVIKEFSHGGYNNG